MQEDKASLKTTSIPNRPIMGNLPRLRTVLYLLGAFAAASLTMGSLTAASLNQRLLSTAKSDAERRALGERLHYIDEVYGQLAANLKAGRPIVIFLDPAHGILKNGMSQSIKTNRMSTRRLTEEYYSLRISRQLYRQFSRNRNFRLVTTPSLLTAIEGNSATYDNIGFGETVRLARKNKAALIISEHLNNSALARRHNWVLKRGIWPTKNEHGKPYLAYNKTVEDGFLTLYNPWDTTNLSRGVAHHTARSLRGTGFRPNSWGKGLVPDRRFVYFNEFPVSIIFESGFICTPRDERLLYSRKGQQQLGRAHYQAVVRSFSDLLGVNLMQPVKSGSRINHRRIARRIRGLKLMRTALFHLHRGRVSLSERLTAQALKSTPRSSQASIRSHYKRLQRIRGQIAVSLKPAFTTDTLKARIGTVKKSVRECSYYALSRVKSILRKRLGRLRRSLARQQRFAREQGENGSVEPKILSEQEQLELEKQRRIRRLNARPYLVVKYRHISWQRAVRNTLGSTLYPVAGASIQAALAGKYARKGTREGLFLVWLNHDKQFTSRRTAKRTLVPLDAERFFHHQLLRNTDQNMETVRTESPLQLTSY
jgi:N-acetylmuramoyl-L-alanine amidase